MKVSYDWGNIESTVTGSGKWQSWENDQFYCKTWM